MKYILSCTTTVNRLDIFYYGIQSLLNQTLTPDLFIVNISEDDFKPKGNKELPSWLNNPKVKINLTKDIGPYTKLIPTFGFADSENDIIITADDDIIYHKDWLKQLVESSMNNPNLIVCSRARTMKKNVFNRWINYSMWKDVNYEYESLDLLPLGVGGVVYKKELLDMDFTLNRNFIELAPGTDDLWFKMASYRKNIRVKVIPAIDLNNMRIIHSLGLEETNLKKSKKQSTVFIIKTINYLKNYFLNYMGISQTRNDKNWKVICKLQESKQV